MSFRASRDAKGDPWCCDRSVARILPLLKTKGIADPLHPPFALPGVPWEYCPRSALKKVLAAAEAEYGITFVIGQEIEFYVLEGVPRILEEPGRTRGIPPPVDSSVYCQAR